MNLIGIFNQDVYDICVSVTCADARCSRLLGSLFRTRDFAALSLLPHVCSHSGWPLKFSICDANFFWMHCTMQLFACLTSEHHYIWVFLSMYDFVSHRRPRPFSRDVILDSCRLLFTVASELSVSSSLCWATHFETVSRYCCFPLLPKTVPHQHS